MSRVKFENIIHKYYYVLLIVLGLVFCFFMYLKYNNNNSIDLLKDITYKTENFVKTNRLPPTISSRYYALISTTYYKSYKKNNNDKQCAYTNSLMLLYKLQKKEIDFEKGVTCDTSTYEEVWNWHDSDAEFKKTDYLKPKNSKWYSVAPPVTPNAGNWKRFLYTTSLYQVPKPPTDFTKELQSLKASSSKVSIANMEIIHFFAGGPGTEGPAGIWINIFYDKLKNKKLSEEEVAYKQMILTQTLADTFSECWKVKFTYWTARPEMLENSVVQIMNSPNFPSYVSGHSTISASVAQVLTYFFPEDGNYYIDMAIDAKNSRKNAGIHFPVDNEEGYKLGEFIGKNIVSKIK